MLPIGLNQILFPSRYVLSLSYQLTMQLTKPHVPGMYCSGK